MFEKIAAAIAGVTDTVRTMLHGLAINAQDKAKIDGILSELETIAEAVSNASGGEIVVRESDVEKAVAAVLPAMVADAVAKALAAQGAPDNVQNVPAVNPVPVDAGTDTAHTIING